MRKSSTPSYILTLNLDIEKYQKLIDKIARLKRVKKETKYFIN